MIRLTLKRDPATKNSEEDNAESSVINQNVMPKLRINLTSLNNSSNTNNTVTLPHYGLEEQFILRLPPSLASILSSELAENDYSSPGDLNIKFISGRTAIVKHPRFIKDAYPAVMFDSPTIMETLKNSTLTVTEICKSEDKGDEEEGNLDANQQNQLKSMTNNESDINVGQYYKVADLNQILMVLDLDTQDGQRVFNRVPQVLQEQLLKSLSNPLHHHHHHPSALDDVTVSWAQLQDGLTPPMKAVKQKKFAPRPLHATNVGEMERIERELERLLKSDGQAIESKFSLIGADGEILLGDTDFIDTGATENDEDVVMIGGNEDIEDSAENEDNEELIEEDYEDEDGSSASDIDDMNDFAAEIEDNLFTLQQPEQLEQDPITLQEQPPIESETDRLVKDLEGKLAEKLKQAESVSNPLIKARIEDVIKQLEDNLKNLRGN